MFLNVLRNKAWIEITRPEMKISSLKWKTRWMVWILGRYRGKGVSELEHSWGSHSECSAEGQSGG